MLNLFNLCVVRAVEVDDLWKRAGRVFRANAAKAFWIKTLIFIWLRWSYVVIYCFCETNRPFCHYTPIWKWFAPRPRTTSNLLWQSVNRRALAHTQRQIIINFHSDGGYSSFLVDCATADYRLCQKSRSANAAYIVQQSEWYMPAWI